MNQSIVHVALLVPDYDEAIAFFSDNLKFTLMEHTYQPDENKQGVLMAPPGSCAASLLLARAATLEQERMIGNQTENRGRGLRIAQALRS